MVSIVSLLLVLAISILVTRIATIALTHTGLSRESARFQARSAFTGVGFTTSESERVVNHPVRRRILLVLMLLGNAGIVTAMSSLILSFINPEDSGSMTARMLILVVGVVFLLVAANSRWLDRRLSIIIRWALNRYTNLEIRDYARLLKLTGDYSVTELAVKAGDWLEDRTLGELKLRKEGIIVLGVTRLNGKYIGVPSGDTKIFEGDTLILYGRSSGLQQIDRRVRGVQGDLEHNEASREQAEVAEKEKQEDEAGRKNDNPKS